MELTAKIEIFPTPAQKDTLWKLSERCRLLYNFALKERMDAFKDNVKIGYLEQQNDLPRIKKRYPQYAWVHSKVLQGTLRHLDTAYRSYNALKKKGDMAARPPRYKGRGEFATMTYNQSGFKIRDSRITLSQFCNNIALAFEIPKKYVFDKVLEVSMSSRHGRYFLSVVYQFREKEYVDNGRYIAIDLGVSNIITSVNTEAKSLQVRNKRPDTYWEKRIESIQARKSHCRKGSRKYKKLHKHELWMRNKSANQIRDFQHKVSDKLVRNTKANTIIIGDLSPKQMVMKDYASKYAKGLHRSLQNTGTIGRFAGFLKYKAKKMGKKVEEISERDTTKMCSACGKMHGMKLSDRIMECDCGNHIDRDINSAINIMNGFLSQNALVAGLSAFALKLRQTGLLNDNDGSVLAEVPYAGGDTAGFAGGEDPPVRGVYKG